jgi:hypothetical protein
MYPANGRHRGIELQDEFSSIRHTLLLETTEQLREASPSPQSAEQRVFAHKGHHQVSRMPEMLDIKFSIGRNSALYRNCFLPHRSDQSETCCDCCDVAEATGRLEATRFREGKWAAVLPESYKEFWPVRFSLSTRN